MHFSINIKNICHVGLLCTYAFVSPSEFLLCVCHRSITLNFVPTLLHFHALDLCFLVWWHFLCFPSFFFLLLLSFDRSSKRGDIWRGNWQPARNTLLQRSTRDTIVAIALFVRNLFDATSIGEKARADRRLIENNIFPVNLIDIDIEHFRAGNRYHFIWMSKAHEILFFFLYGTAVSQRQTIL